MVLIHSSKMTKTAPHVSSHTPELLLEIPSFSLPVVLGRSPPETESFWFLKITKKFPVTTFFSIEMPFFRIISIYSLFAPFSAIRNLLAPNYSNVSARSVDLSVIRYLFLLGLQPFFLELIPGNCHSFF